MAFTPEDVFGRQPKLNFERAKKSILLPGMFCVIIRSGSYGDFRGRVVKLVKNFPHYEDIGGGKMIAKDYWQTEPPLKGPAGPNGEMRQLKFFSDSMMSVSNTQIINALIIERREDCKSDPRIAGYILGREAAYNWRQGKDPF